MFDSPIPVPSASHYATLGVRPEATAEELREAMSELAAALRVKKQEVTTALEAVRTAVPGLREAAAEVQKLQADSKADPAAVAAAGRALSQLEVRAVAQNPRYRELCDRERELDDEVLRVNRMALQNTTERLAYDRDHPPFELLKLVDCARDELADPRVTATRLREELIAFLLARGEPVFHPSDLTRTDFTSDFAPNPLLDGPG